MANAEQAEHNWITVYMNHCEECGHYEVLMCDVCGQFVDPNQGEDVVFANPCEVTA